jgi:hypothetical protein
MNSNWNVVSGSGTWLLKDVGNAFTVNVTSGTVNVSPGAYLNVKTGSMGGSGQLVKDGLGILRITSAVPD